MAKAQDEQWTQLCRVADIPQEGGQYITCGNRALGVFMLGGDRVRVIDDTCPHAGGSLSAGQVDEGCVYCPWHAWPFDLETGQCSDNRSIQVRVYPVRVIKGRVYAKLVD